MDVKTLTDGMTVSGQLGPDDVAELARRGVTLVINNRPDNEAPGQPDAADGARAAAAAGIAYRHIPVRFQTLQADEIDRFGEAVASAGGPVHAHCASGARSANLWALAQIRRGDMTRDAALAWAAERQVDLRPGLAWLDRQP